MSPLTIPEPPEPKACAGCNLPISWLWSARTERWVAFVAASEDSWKAIAPHMCAPPLQDLKVWRSLPHGSPPNDDYLAAKQALKSATEE